MKSSSTLHSGLGSSNVSQSLKVRFGGHLIGAREGWAALGALNLLADLFSHMTSYGQLVYAHVHCQTYAVNSKIIHYPPSDFPSQILVVCSVIMYICVYTTILCCLYILVLFQHIAKSHIRMPFCCV